MRVICPVLAFLFAVSLTACQNGMNEPSAEPSAVYTLKDGFDVMTMSEIALYEDGTAVLQQAAIRSYLLPDATYKISGDSLTLYEKIGDGEELYDGDAFAEFKIKDDGDTLVFVSSRILLYVTEGTEYVRTAP
jgi:hypothetical protein